MLFFLAVSVVVMHRAMAAGPTLEKGTSMTLNASVSNPDYVTGLRLDNLVVLTDANRNEYPVAYLNVPNTAEYYLLRSGVSLYELNLPQKMYLGGWPLKRTADDSQPNIEQLSAANETKPEPDEYDFYIGTDNAQVLGCLWSYPLRYGDINGDGNQELVLLPGASVLAARNNRLDFAIFSLQTHSVIFSVRLAREAVGPQMTKFDPNYKNKANYGNFPQILDSSAYDPYDAAMRYYAKLYFGDFDGNGKPDIIAWRKRYDSRPISDPVQGYKLTAQLLTHYELDNGVYKAQPTDEATIKGWLAAKNLTWQKGYPSTSECASDAGKPIPEMVDPTLNDPDVLQ